MQEILDGTDFTFGKDIPTELFCWVYGIASDAHTKRNSTSEGTFPQGKRRTVVGLCRVPLRKKVVVALTLTKSTTTNVIRRKQKRVDSIVYRSSSFILNITAVRIHSQFILLVSLDAVFLVFLRIIDWGTTKRCRIRQTNGFSKPLRLFRIPFSVYRIQVKVVQSDLSVSGIRVVPRSFCFLFTLSIHRVSGVVQGQHKVSHFHIVQCVHLGLKLRMLCPVCLRHQFLVVLNFCEQCVNSVFSSRLRIGLELFKHTPELSLYGGIVI